MPVVDNDISVYVLQHPDEIKNAKGTAIIASLYLKKYESLVGEDFNQNQTLINIIRSNLDSTYVVYHDNNSLPLARWANKITAEDKTDLDKINLIFIDASWRKAKKIWLSSSILKQCKCIKLPDCTESNYRIRKISEPGYVSTIEAMVICLATLEQSAEKYLPLLQVFDKMIDAQIERMGAQTYTDNYNG